MGVSLHVSTGEKLSPDYFLDEAVDMTMKVTKEEEVKADTGADAPASGDTPATVFSRIRPHLNETVTQQIKATFLFVLSGDNPGAWLLDLKNGSGSVGETAEDTPADVTMKMDSKNMVKMFQGQLNPTTAFMMGQLKISGNMGQAMKLEKLMAQVRSKL